MAIKDDTVKEIVDFYCTHGTVKTLEAFPDINAESLNRYKRLYRYKFGDLQDVTARMLDKFSPEELETLVKMNTDVVANNFVQYDFSGDELTFLFLTDTHYGSKYSDPTRTEVAFAEAKKRGCLFAIHGGDITEGHMNRPNSVYENTHHGFKAQRNHAIEILKQWELPLYLCNGNHDLAYDTKLGAGCNMAEDICDKVPNSVFVGDGLGTFELPKQKIKIQIYHGCDSGGSSYALSYRLQRIINNMNPSQKPHILLTGHDHKSFMMHYRNIFAVAGGCMQKQTAWMAGKGLQAMEGFWIIKMGLGMEEVKWFEPRFYPFYK